jgi:hypothetical protein
MDWRISVTSAGTQNIMVSSSIIPWKEWAATLITFAQQWRVPEVVHVLRAITVEFKLHARQIAESAAEN